MTAPATRRPAPRAHPRRLLTALCIAQFMLVLDITVVNVALPHLAADLELGRAELTWTITAYILCFGGLMLLGGRTADVFGARRVLIGGLVTFTLASLASATATDATWLIGARAGQGIGAAFVSPAALALLTSTHHGHARHRALAVWSAIGGVGFAAGALVGGALTSGPGWRWIFWINVPVGILLVLALPLVTPAVTGRRRRIDALGAALVTFATASLIYGLVQAGEDGWTGGSTLAALAIGIASYAAFAYAECHVRAPLMRVTLLTQRSVLTGCTLMLAATALMVGAFFLGSLYLQHAVGYGAMRTGLMFAPPAVAVTAGAHLAGSWMRRIGPRPIALGGLSSAAVGAALLATVSDGASVLATVLPGMTLLALGVGPVFVTATTTAMGSVDADESGLASGLVNTFHELGGAFGVAVLSSVAAGSLATGQVDGFRAAYLVCAIIACLTALAATALVPRGVPTMSAGSHAH